MFLLDSNVISELRSSKRCHPRVKVWQQKTPPDACWISAITLLEIRQGIDQMAAKDRGFAKILERWLEERVKVTFAGRVLSVTPAVAEKGGRIAAIRTRDLADCLIAATAIEGGLTLVTRNESDFTDIFGLPVLNPWKT